MTGAVTAHLPKTVLKPNDFHVPLLQGEVKDTILTVGCRQLGLEALIAHGHPLQLLVEAIQLLNVFLTHQQLLMFLLL